MARQVNVAAHTRKATTGTVTKENAHPLTSGKIIGAHNGIVNNHDALNLLYNRKHDVDSHHIFSHLDEGRSLNEIEGWGSAWYQYRDKPESIYLFKARLGELAIFGVGMVKHCTGIIFASTESIILEGAHLAGLKVFRYQIDEGTLYRIAHGELKYIEGEKMQFKEPKWLALDGVKEYYGEWKREWKGDSMEDDTRDYCDGCDKLCEEYELNEEGVYSLCWKCERYYSDSMTR